MAMIEKPTPIERLVQLIPLRYPLASLTLTIISGPIGFRVANYIQSGASPFQSPNPPNEILGILLLFYVYYTVRYLRLKIVKAEPLITPIMSGGQNEYGTIFGRVNSTRSIALLTVIFEVLALLVTSEGLTLSAVTVYSKLDQVILIIAFSTLVWEYAASSWGLHKLGQSQLKLKSFLEDRFMGARSIGNVALSLTIAYLGGLLLFFLDSATFLPVTTNLGFASFYLILLALGVVMFFLPLDSIHKKMQIEKADHQRELGRQLLTINQSSSGQSSNCPGSIENVEKAVTELVRLKNLEITEKKLASTPSWPFDIQLLAKLITIVLSVTAVLLTRLITDYLIHI
jgi:hypothetical protein